MIPDTQNLEPGREESESVGGAAAAVSTALAKLLQQAPAPTSQLLTAQSSSPVAAGASAPPTLVAPLPLPQKQHLPPPLAAGGTAAAAAAADHSLVPTAAAVTAGGAAIGGVGTADGGSRFDSQIKKKGRLAPTATRSFNVLSPMHGGGSAQRPQSPAGGTLAGLSPAAPSLSGRASPRLLSPGTPQQPLPAAGGISTRSSTLAADRAPERSSDASIAAGGGGGPTPLAPVRREGSARRSSGVRKGLSVSFHIASPTAAAAAAAEGGSAEPPSPEGRGGEP